MNLEEEINQKIFINEHQKLLINLLVTNNWLIAKNKSFFDDAAITQQQYNILRILRGAKDALSTLQIRERMMDKMSDTSRIVDRLILKGYTLKTVNTTDKRLVCVTITPKGLELLQSLDSKEMDMVHNLSNLTTKEAAKLNELLDKIRNK